MAISAARPTTRPTYRSSPAFSSRWRDFDLYMLTTTTLLIGFGVVSIWSATGGGALTIGSLAVRQAMYGAVGIGLMVLLANFDYRIFSSFAWPLYGIGLTMLTLVLIPGIGTNLGLDSRRWFLIGGTTVQPAEFVKPLTAIALAAFIASRGAAMAELGNFLVSMLIVGAPMFLVFREPDLGTSVVYGVIWASMMLVTRTRKRYFFALISLVLPVAFVAWEFLLRDYQRARWLVFLNPESDRLGEGFNILQAEISVGSGGLFGFGLRGGTQSQAGLLKVRESDFIFSHASGMFGFIGMLALFASFAILLWRCIRVVDTARDTFGQCLAIGLSGMLFFQAFVNIGMNLGLMPVTGITLPFVSSGLSSLWTFLCAEGLLQSILMRHRKLAFKPD